MAACHSAWIVGDAATTGAESGVHIFPWWSFTKTVLALATLHLVEQGKLELDALLPDKPYTLRQLLTHRAGIPNYGRLPAYHAAVSRGEPAWPRDRLLKTLSADKLDFEPGTGWSYSNVGYLFVRDVIEETVGLPLGEALHELVFLPLNLSSVRLATTHADFERTYWRKLRGYDPQWVYHGCLIGTPADAARLLHSVFRGDFLRDTSVHAIFERSTLLHEKVPNGPWTKMSYALGMMSGVAAGVGRAWGHSGSGPHSATAVYHFPDLERPVTVAAFTEGEAEGPAEFEAISIAARTQQR